MAMPISKSWRDSDGRYVFDTSDPKLAVCIQSVLELFEGSEVKQPVALGSVS
jgi:hypothetical protein